MKLKWVIYIILVSIPVLMTQQSLEAVNTSRIDSVLKKKVLEEQDYKIIDDFISNTITALINERDYSHLADYRIAIVSRKGTQVQYVDKFMESAKTHLKNAFTDAEKLRPAKRKITVTTNLLILVDGLKNVELAIFAMNKLEDENAMIRYWAAQCLTNPTIINQLNSGGASNPNLAQEITQKFIKIVPNCNPETLNHIAGFASSIDNPLGEQLLLLIADQRIKSYADWTVKQEFIDGNILKLLENRISNPLGDTDIKEVAHRFGQLYSYVIQRYIKGREEDILNEIQIKQLITVIIDTEAKCITNLLGAQLIFKSAIERGEMLTLMDEHNKLLGGDNTTGKLPEKFGFNYGSNSNAPLTLPDPR